jgi:hypothetical protein
MAFTAQLSTGIVPIIATDWSAAGCVFGRMQVVDADVRIYVQEVRAVHTAASDGGMRAAVRLSGLRRARPPCPPDRTRLPHHVGRRASGRRKVRAPHRRIARSGKIARSRMQLLRRPGFQDGETCQGESISASLTDLASQDPGEFPSSRPDFLARVHGTRCGAQCTGRHVGTLINRIRIGGSFRSIRRSTPVRMGSAAGRRTDARAC